VRNHLIDKGFILPEIYVGKKYFGSCLKISKNSEFKISYRISEKHINVRGTLRQNVKLSVLVA